MIESIQRSLVEMGPIFRVPRWRLLVIGYGNELLGDDAAGPLLARRIGRCRYAGTKVLVAPMLLPEMAVDMSQSDRVLFVDASVRCSKGRVRLSPVMKARHHPALSCAYSPETLFSLCGSLSGRRPKSWAIEVPSARFDLGRGLSETTVEGMEKSARLIRRWVQAIQCSFTRKASIHTLS